MGKDPLEFEATWIRHRIRAPEMRALLDAYGAELYGRFWLLVEAMAHDSQSGEVSVVEFDLQELTVFIRCKSVIQCRVAVRQMELAGLISPIYFDKDVEVTLKYPIEIEARDYSNSEKRRIRMRSAGPLTRELRQAVLDRDHRMCQWCDSTADLTIDHVTAVVRGGKTILENLQVLCGSCNAKKGFRDV